MPKRSYAIWWHEGDGPKHAGKLELGRLHMLLSGNAFGRVAVPLDQITSVGYTSGELMVRRRGGSPLRIGSLDARSCGALGRPAAAWISVNVVPGDTVLTRMPSVANSFAAPTVSRFSAALLMAYGM